MRGFWHGRKCGEIAVGRQHMVCGGTPGGLRRVCNTPHDIYIDKPLPHNPTTQLVYLTCTKTTMQKQ